MDRFFFLTRLVKYGSWFRRAGRSRVNKLSVSEDRTSKTAGSPVPADRILPMYSHICWYSTTRNWKQHKPKHFINWFNNSLIVQSWCTESMTYSLAPGVRILYNNNTFIDIIVSNKIRNSISQLTRKLAQRKPHMSYADANAKFEVPITAMHWCSMYKFGWTDVTKSSILSVCNKYTNLSWLLKAMLKDGGNMWCILANTWFLLRSKPEICNIQSRYW